MLHSLVPYKLIFHILWQGRKSVILGSFHRTCYLVIILVYSWSFSKINLQKVVLIPWKLKDGIIENVKNTWSASRVWCQDKMEIWEYFVWLKNLCSFYLRSSCNNFETEYGISFTNVIDLHLVQKSLLLQLSIWQIRAFNEGKILV